MTLEEFKNKLEQDKALKAEMLEAIKAGREEEFLAAQGVEVPEKKELSDEELEGAAGGGDNILRGRECKWDSKGRPIEWLVAHESRRYVYYTCAYCGRVLHEGSYELLYCDPCNNWFFPCGNVVEHVESYY